MKSVARLALGFGFTIAAFGTASASPVTFTWDPAAVGLNAGSTIVGNNFNVSDFANVNIAANGGFTEQAVLPVLSFLNGGFQQSPVGYGSAGGYNFYLTFSGTGMQGAIPVLNSGDATTGSFLAGAYTLYASPNATTNVAISPGSAPAISNNGGAFALFGGQLLSGTVTLTAPTAFHGQDAGYSPSANIDLSIEACTGAGQMLSSGVTCSGDESAFFSNPLPADLNLLFGNFSANTQIVTLTSGENGSSILDINGGGGNITLATVPVPVPEPASMLILGSSLLGITMLRRRRIRG